MARRQHLASATQAIRGFGTARTPVRFLTHFTQSSIRYVAQGSVHNKSIHWNRGAICALSRPFTTRALQSYLNDCHRPQLPFLHSSNLARVTPPRELPLSVALFTRQISSHRKERWRAQLKWQLRFHAYFWPLFVLALLFYMGVQQTRFEHQFPTPHEWGLWARWELRTARWFEETDEGKSWGVVVDWGRVGEYLSRLVVRLENPKREGENTKVQEFDGAEMLIEGVGKMGLNVEEKSEAWRTGYFQCLMGLARVAEHLDGLAIRREAKEKEGLRAKKYHWDNVLGPDNPRPKPLPWDKKGDYLKPPNIEDVEQAFEPPEVWYMKILTTKGFTNRQRLDAALAYADWCDFKGLKETSGDMYDWALDIAISGLPEGYRDVVTKSTGVISAGKEALVSENILRATTALGVHKARNGDVKDALPVLLSVLRARKNLPAPPPGYEQLSGSSSALPETGLTGWIRSIKEFVSEVPYPRPPSSGDDRPFHTLKEACEEVGIMTYIGEILFARSEQEREKGMSWTRDSVDAAEAVMWFMDEKGESRSADGRKKCQECLETGLQNWMQMAQQMTKLAKYKEQQVAQWHGLFGTGYGKANALDQAMQEVKRWEDEQTQIELRLQKTISLVNPVKPSGGQFFASV